MEGGDRVSRASQWPWRARLTWRPASPARPRAALRVALRPLPRQASDDPPGPRATPPALLRPPPSGSRAAPQPCLTPPRVPLALIPHRPGTLPPASLWAGLPWKTHLLSSGSWGLPAHRGGGGPSQAPHRAPGRSQTRGKCRATEPAPGLHQRRGCTAGPRQPSGHGPGRRWAIGGCLVTPDSGWPLPAPPHTSPHHTQTLQFVCPGRNKAPPRPQPVPTHDPRHWAFPATSAGAPEGRLVSRRVSWSVT